MEDSLLQAAALREMKVWRCGSRKYGDFADHESAALCCPESK
jgi:hypothetical protein